VPFVDPAEPDSVQGVDGRWSTVLHFPALLPNSSAPIVTDPDNPSLHYLTDFATIEWPLPLDTAAIATFVDALNLEPRGTWPPLHDVALCVFRFKPPATSFRDLEAILERIARYPGVRSVHAFSRSR
jgi:hypothetical protein